jgi:predicted ATPase
MLTKFTLANFKSYRNATLDLSPLTLLIGANASGKSNALEAMQMLSWLSRGRRLEDVFQAVQESELLMRGTVADLAFGGTGNFRLGCVMEPQTWNKLEVEMSAGSDGMRIVQERIEGPINNPPLYQVSRSTKGFSHDLLVSYNNFARGRNKPQMTCTDQQAVFTQMLTPASFAAGHKLSQEVIPGVAKTFVQALEHILFLDPMPRQMRDYSFVMDKVLKGNGSNLSSTLYDLCETQKIKDKVLEFVRDLPEQDITDIQFLEGPRKEVMVKLEETFGGTRQYREAAVLSDGTLRVIAVAAALLSAHEGSMVVVEEIDNGVHPSRARTLLANIERVAREKKLVVVLTSHNPALLDALPPSAIPDAVFCYRDPQQGDSRLVRLSQLPDYPELVAQGPLGRLVTQGILDRFVKNAKPPGEKLHATLAWIEDLEKKAALP